MNKLSLLILLSWATLGACDAMNGNRALVKFIPGTYIRFSQHGFGSEYDTIQVRLQHIESMEYRIIRKWRYERVIDGVPLEPEYKRKITTAIFKPEQKYLQEVETGQVYSFQIKSNQLVVGTVKYQKL